VVACSTQKEARRGADMAVSRRLSLPHEAAALQGRQQAGSSGVSAAAAAAGSGAVTSRRDALPSMQQTVLAGVAWDSQVQQQAADASDPLQHIKQLQLLRRRSGGLPALPGDAATASCVNISSAADSAADGAVHSIHGSLAGGQAPGAVLPAIPSTAMSPAGSAVRLPGHHRRTSSLGSTVSGSSSVNATPRGTPAAAVTAGSRRTSSTQLPPLEENTAVLTGLLLPPIAAAGSSRRGSRADDCSSTAAVAAAQVLAVEQGSSSSGHGKFRSSQRHVEADVAVVQECSLSSVLSTSSASCSDGSGLDAGPGLRCEPSSYGMCGDNPAAAVQLHRPPLVGKLQRLRNRLSSRHIPLQDEQPLLQQQQPVDTPPLQRDRFSDPAGAGSSTSHVGDPSGSAVGPAPVAHHGRSKSSSLALQPATAPHVDAIPCGHYDRRHSGGCGSALGPLHESKR
jgi:hypothetical protein